MHDTFDCLLAVGVAAVLGAGSAGLCVYCFLRRKPSDLYKKTDVEGARDLTRQQPQSALLRSAGNPQQIRERTAALAVARTEPPQPQPLSSLQRKLLQARQSQT